MLLGIVLHMPHVRGDAFTPVVRDQPPQLLLAPPARRNLSFQVRQIVVDVAGRVRPGCKQRPRLRLAQPARLHQQEVVDQDALVLDRPAVRRHRARRDPANVCMVPARRGEESRRGVAHQDHWRNHSDVGKMRAPRMRRVQHVDVAGLHRGSAFADHRPDRLAHRSEMYRNMRRIRHQPARCVEHRTREIQPLADVHRRGARLQRKAHLLRHAHEAIVENFKQNRIHTCSDRRARLRRSEARQHKIAIRRHRPAPTGFDERRRPILQNQRRTVDSEPCRDVSATQHGRLERLAR